MGKRYQAYKANELQSIAEQYVKEFNPEMLVQPCEDFDVYEVLEHFGYPYDWQYLSADHSVLGLTAFNGGRLCCWADHYMKNHDSAPTKIIDVEPGTIIIDRWLNEHGVKGRENFTVMHEFFHNILHRDFFLGEQATKEIIVHRDEKKKNNFPKRRRRTSLDWIEWQADTCAACFLMPHQAVQNKYNELTNGKILDSSSKQLNDEIIPELSKCFQVSKQAMFYRLKELGLIESSDKQDSVDEKSEAEITLAEKWAKQMKQSFIESGIDISDQVDEHGNHMLAYSQTMDDIPPTDICYYFNSEGEKYDFLNIYVLVMTIDDPDKQDVLRGLLNLFNEDFKFFKFVVDEEGHIEMRYTAFLTDCVDIDMIVGYTWYAIGMLKKTYPVLEKLKND